MTKHNIVFAILSAVLFLLMGFSIYRENNPEWKEYQREFYRLMAKKTGDAEFANTPLKVRQIWLPTMDRTDRCMTCHTGIDMSAFADAPQPYTAHPDLSFQLKTHPFRKFGCTVCHEGDGRATTYEGTHGNVEHIEKLMLVGNYIQSSCTKCHFDIYTRDEDLPGTEVLMKGMRRITENRDCKKACHTIRQIGWKGTKAPNINSFGSQTELAFYLKHDFTYIEGEHTIANWEYEHFLDPESIVPGDEKHDIEPTIMPDLGLSEEEAKALSIFVLSLKDPKIEKIPYQYIPKSALLASIENK
ncbi:MAG: cytochrome c, class I [Thermodesulfobacteriota bacterium]